MRGLIRGAGFHGSFRGLLQGGAQRRPPWRRRGSLLASLAAAWALMAGECRVRACGNPFEAIMCPVAAGAAAACSGVGP